jgi:hypothetical protein
MMTCVHTLLKILKKKGFFFLIEYEKLVIIRKYRPVFYMQFILILF